MTENKNNKISRSRAYFIYLIIILIFVNIIDSYTTILQGLFPSAIAKEFLSEYPTNEQNAIMAFGSTISSLGFYFIFINQYLADKIGRKKMLAFTVFGMGFTCFLIIFSINYIQFVFFTLLLCFFFSSDIWAIYINEESNKEKRAVYSHFVLIVGLIGPISAIILRSIFITETVSNWRALMFLPIIIGFPLSIIILLTLKETSKYQLLKKDEKVKEQESISFKNDLKAIFKTENRQSYIVMLIMSSIFGGSTIWRNLFEKYITDVGTLTQTQITIIFIWTVPAVLIAWFINGMLADRIGRKPLIYIWSGLLPIAVVTWAIGAHNSENAFIIVQIGFALMHLSFWGLYVIMTLITIEILPTDKRGTGLGFRILFFAIGTTIGLLLSSISILFLGLGISFIIFISAMFVLIPLTYFFIKETKGVELSEIK
jgi:MHS family alpha-ketoglutarate permease-like MFS transporter